MDLDDILGATDPALQRVGIRYVIATGPQGAPCLTELRAPARPGERYVYEVVPNRG